jgi:hypothetical protein
MIQIHRTTYPGNDGSARVTNRKSKEKKMPKGLYANIHAKRKRIKAGSGETMRKPGTKGAPTSKSFKKAAKTAKKKKS